MVPSASRRGETARKVSSRARSNAQSTRLPSDGLGRRVEGGQGRLPACVACTGTTRSLAPRPVLSRRPPLHECRARFRSRRPAAARVGGIGVAAAALCAAAVTWRAGRWRRTGRSYARAASTQHRAGAGAAAVRAVRHAPAATSTGPDARVSVAASQTCLCTRRLQKRQAPAVNTWSWCARVRAPSPCTTARDAYGCARASAGGAAARRPAHSPAGRGAHATRRSGAARCKSRGGVVRRGGLCARRMPVLRLCAELTRVLSLHEATSCARGWRGWKAPRAQCRAWKPPPRFWARSARRWRTSCVPQTKNSSQHIAHARLPLPTPTRCARRARALAAIGRCTPA